jgi:uncharacterized caspase-like protein
MKTRLLIPLVVFLQAFSCLAQQKAVLTFAEAKQLADRGDARAQAIVAMHYQLGWQTEKNEALAGRYAQASAEAGHPLGIYRLGNLLVSGINGQKDPNTGYKLQAASFEPLSKIAGNNQNPDPYAMTSVGIMLFQGKVCLEDKVKAISCYKWASEYRFAPALFNYIMATNEGQGVDKDPVAYYHLLGGGTFGAGCECVVCKGYGNVDANTILQDYPPAKKFIADNSEKVKSAMEKIANSFGVISFEDKYWKSTRNTETSILEPNILKGISSNWNPLISIKTNTGAVQLKMRSNYSGLTKTDPNDSGVGDGTFTNWLHNIGLFSTIQYYVNNTDKGLKIESTTPIEFKNRMAICEYPIALEIQVTNNSKEPINLEQFGFYVQSTSFKDTILPGLIFEEGEKPEDSKIILHNFGWGSWDTAAEAKLTLWDTSMPVSDTAGIKIANNESADKNAAELFKNKYLLGLLNSHPDYAPRKISLDFPMSDRREKFIFEPNFSRKASDFYTKIAGEAKLPSDRSNYRFMYEAKKQIEPGESYKFNLTFEFEKSTTCTLKPLVKINGSINEGHDIQVDYDTYNYYYNPQKTFSIDGNGDASISSVQMRILGIGFDQDEKDRNDSLNKFGKDSLAENNTRPLLQSSSNVMVPDNSDGEIVIYENILPGGRNDLVISAERQGNALFGHISIVSKNRNQVVFRAPWSFDDVIAAGGGFELSVVAAANNQWVSWFLKDDNKGRLYCIFPGKNSTVYAPSSPSMPVQEKLGGEYKRIIKIGSESENDIESLGSDLDGKGLVVNTKKGSYIIPLGSRQASLLQDSINAEGLAVVSVEGSDLADNLRFCLQMPIIAFTGEKDIADVKTVTLPSESNKFDDVTGLLWLSNDSIGVKKLDKWEVWSISTGSIAQATLDENQAFDKIQSSQEAASLELLEKFNKTRDLENQIKNAYVLEANGSLLLVEQQGVLSSFFSILRNGLEISYFDPNNNDRWPKSRLIVNPFGVGKQFSKKSEFFDKVAISSDRKMVVASSKSGNILYIIDLAKSYKRGDSLGLVSSNESVPLCVVRSPSFKNFCTVVSRDGYYLSGDGSAEGVVLSDGLNAVGVAQLEVKYNRPDIVLERLGAPKETVDEAKRLRQRLARRSDFKNLEGASLIDVPVVSLPTDTSSYTGEKNLNISYSATNSSGNLKELLVYNNGALVSKSPLLGKNGEPGLDAEGAVDLHLASGENKIQLCAVNEDGVPSNFAEKVITCTALPAARETYIVTCGVSEYKDTNFNLRYAAKDAGDVAEALKKSAESRGFTPKVLTLKNGEVDSETVSKIRNFLASATADDEVFLFFAGHGLLDKDLNYHYARSDTDFSATENIGIQFDELESLVDCIKPLKRTVLFDTCHSGEVEEESKADVRAMVAGQSVDTNEAAKVQSTKIATRGMKVNAIAPKVSHSELINLEKLFPDSRRAKGANILTSSSGSEFSMESAEWNNGLFTYSLLKALQDPATDENKDGCISFSEAAENVKKKVTQLSGGKQRPITRGVNREQDPILVSFNPAKAESTAPKTAPAPSTPVDKKEEKKSWWSFGS